MMMMYTYQIRWDGDDRFTITKWDGGTRPTQTYRVDLHRKSCSCPSGIYRKYCKHIDKVRKLKDLVKNTDQVIGWEE